MRERPTQPRCVRSSQQPSRSPSITLNHAERFNHCLFIYTPYDTASPHFLDSLLFVQGPQAGTEISWSCPKHTTTFMGSIPALYANKSIFVCTKHMAHCTYSSQTQKRLQGLHGKITQVCRGETLSAQNVSSRVGQSQSFANLVTIPKQL